jgi:hypothetical protein
LNLIRCDPQQAQVVIQQDSGPRAALAVDESYSLMGEILQGMDIQWVSSRNQEALLSFDEGKHEDRCFRKILADVREVVLARLRVKQVRTGEVGLLPA